GVVLAASGELAMGTGCGREGEGLEGGAAGATPPIVEQRVDIAPDTLAFVRDAMADVVNGAGGTAHKAQLPGITVCGKTGTAQVVANKGSLEAGMDEDKMPEKYRDHAWFIAFAPKEHPQIAIACIVEHGGHGGSAAAPAVHDVMQRFFELNPPAPKPELTEEDEHEPRPAIAHVLEDDPSDAAPER